MTAKKKQPQPGQPKTYEHFLDLLEDVIVKAEACLAADDFEDAESVRRIVKELRRTLAILKAPPPTQGEQG